MQTLAPASMWIGLSHELDVMQVVGRKQHQQHTFGMA